MSMTEGAPPPGYPPPPPPGSPVIVNVPPAPQQQDDRLTRDEAMRLIEKARQEEKDKLYTDQDELRQKVAALTQEREERLQAEQEAQRQAEEEAELRRQAELSQQQRADERQSQFEQELQELRADRDREAALRIKEQEFAQLAQYRADRMAQEADSIPPELAEYVGGSSKEAIDQSIERVKATAAKILAEVQQTQLTNLRQTAPPPTGGPPVDMAALGSDQQRTFSPDDIRNMSMEEYSQYRNQFLQAAGNRVRDQGLYAP